MFFLQIFAGVFTFKKLNLCKYITSKQVQYTVATFSIKYMIQVIVTFAKTSVLEQVQVWVELAMDPVQFEIVGTEPTMTMTNHKL